VSGLVRTVKDVDELYGDIVSLSRHDALAVDTETTGLHPYQDDVLRGVSFAYRKDDTLKSWYLPVSHPDSDNIPVEPFVRLISNTSAHTLWHHGDFDWAFLGGMPRKGRHYDTQVGSWLINENQRTALDQVEYRFLRTKTKALEKEGLASLRKGRSRADIYRELRADGVPVKEARPEAERLQLASKKDFPTFTAEDIADYAANDALVTWQVAHQELDKMVGLDSPLVAVKRENDFQRVLYEIIRRGVRIDQPRLRAQQEIAQDRMDEIVAYFDERGVAVSKNRDVAQYLYDHLELPCYVETPGGEPSVARAALEPLEHMHDDVPLILEYRRAAKAQQGFYTPLLTREGRDGRIHPHLSSCRTVTGRLSCSDPNMQTIPREDVIAGLKACFVPTKGRELWEYDLSQAELRVMASVSKDERMQYALEHGDLHDETARMIFGEFTDLQRRFAKNLNYGFAYGIGPRKFASYMAVGPPRVPITPALIAKAKDVLDGFREAYPQLVRTMKALELYVEDTGIMPLHKPGRYRRFKTYGSPVGYYTALNFVVQGGIAEIMKDVMLPAVLEHAVDGDVVMQVHDSLWIEVDPGAQDKVCGQLQRILDDIVPTGWMPMTFDTKLLTDHAPQDRCIDAGEGNRHP
jgi:DNA polymerase I-like protein with 3'-5' exonuclease and polymerase domains